MRCVRSIRCSTWPVQGAELCGHGQRRRAVPHCHQRRAVSVAVDVQLAFGSARSTRPAAARRFAGNSGMKPATNAVSADSDFAAP